MEWKLRIESVHKDNSPSWVRISHGLNKLVTDLIDKEHNDNEHDASETQFEEYALKLNVQVILQADQRLKQNHKDSYFCQLIHKNCTYWRKNLDRYWTTR